MSDEMTDAVSRHVDTWVAIEAAVWAGVDRALDGPRMGTDEWLAWRQDPAVRRVRGVEALRVARAFGVALPHFVARARHMGALWRDVADVLGVTRQAAQMRYGRRCGERTT